MIVSVTGPTMSNSTIALRARIETDDISFSCHHRDYPLKAPGIVLNEQRFSFLTLRAWRDTIADAFFDIEGAHKLSIDLIRNRVVMGVKPGGLDRVRAFAASQGIPADGFDVEVSEPSNPMACTANGSLHDCFRPVPAGVQVEVAPNGGVGFFGGCTLGAAVARTVSGTTALGFLTNSHCVPPEGVQNSDWSYQATYNFPELHAVEFVDPPFTPCGSYQCRQSDSAFLHHYSGGVQRGTIVQTLANNGTTASCGPSTYGAACIVNSVHPRFYVNGSRSLVMNMQVEKVGRTTGWTTGVVTSVCTDIVDSRGRKWICNAQSTLDTYFGDSGSPVFYWWWFNNVDTVELLGLFWGGDGSFSPMANVYTEIGGSIDVSYTSTFEYLPAESATDVGVGADGSVWIVSATSSGNGYVVKRLVGNSWQTVLGGGAVRIAVDPYGAAWIVNSLGNIYKRTGSSWTLMPDTATDIGIGANGDVWITGTSSVPGGHPIKKWNGTTWTQVDGGAIRIAVGPTGEPWVTNNAKQIFRRSGGISGSWSSLPGQANDIGIGSDGMVWIVASNAISGGYPISRWNGVGWISEPGAAVGVSVAPAGKAWVVNSFNQLFKWL